MNPILTIARFELRYHLRQPAFYLFALLVFGQGIWYSVQRSSLYVYSDPASATYLILSSLGVILAAVSVLLAGQSLTKDIDYRTAPYLFTLPISSRVHFAGRFIGTYATTLLTALFYPLGVYACSVIYSSEPTVSWFILADGFIRLVVQNCFIIVSLTFSLSVFLRSIRGAYIGLFLVVLYFLLTESNTRVIADSDLWKLLDPFGVGMARESIDTTPFIDEPDSLLVFSDIFLINRLLWMGLAMGLLAYAENTFSFSYFISQKPAASQKRGKVVDPLPTRSDLPTVQPRFGGWLSWQTVWRLARMEFNSLIRQPIFPITVGLLVLLTILLATVLGQNPDFPELPITSRLSALRMPMGLFISLFLLVMTTELLFQERTVGFWPIHDAFPQPTIVLLTGKIAALVGIAALLTGVLFLTVVGVQLGSGFYTIDWWRYGADFLMDGFLRYCQLIALGVLVAALVNHRLPSHGINLLVFSILFLFYQSGTGGSLIYLYSFLPGSLTYSDLTGFGTATDLRPVLHFLWWSVAGVFITAFLLTWNRGVISNLPERVHQWRNRFQWPYQLAFTVFGLLLGLSVWQTHQRLAAVPNTTAIRYATYITAVPSVSGQLITVQIRHHHPYQVQHIMRAVTRALHRGEHLFGTYPYADLHVTEIPSGGAPVRSAPGIILISEKQGWVADNRQPQKLDYVDYVISREVFKQWLVHQLRPASAPGQGFVRQSLAEYLALQSVAQQYGPERFAHRLAQRAGWYAKSRQELGRSASLLQSSGNDAVERGQGATVLTSIGEVWGNKPLSLTISQFYRKAIQQPDAATASAFSSELGRQLPHSLHYLQTYLSEPLWFDFKVGRVANLPNGLTLEIIATKWRSTKNGHRELVPINDYIPLVIVNQAGKTIYRQLIHPNPDERFVFLPAIPDARKVIIDPLGAWPENNKRDNSKLL